MRELTYEGEFPPGCTYGRLAGVPSSVLRFVVETRMAVRPLPPSERSWHSPPQPENSAGDSSGAVSSLQNRLGKTSTLWRKRLKWMRLPPRRKPFSIRASQADVRIRCFLSPSFHQSDNQMLLAQLCIINLRRILIEARKVHSRQDYARMAEPILLEVQQRAQEILKYSTSNIEQPVAR
jgi:hypothetical protein